MCDTAVNYLAATVAELQMYQPQAHGSEINKSSLNIYLSKSGLTLVKKVKFCKENCYVVPRFFIPNNVQLQNSLYNILKRI